MGLTGQIFQAQVPVQVEFTIGQPVHDMPSIAGEGLEQRQGREQVDFGQGSANLGIGSQSVVDEGRVDFQRTLLGQDSHIVAHDSFIAVPDGGVWESLEKGADLALDRGFAGFIKRYPLGQQAARIKELLGQFEEFDGVESPAVYSDILDFGCRVLDTIPLWRFMGLPFGLNFSPRWP